MLVVKKLLIVLFILFTFNNYGFANDNISFVDLDYIYSNSVAGKKFIKYIKKESNLINKDFNEYKKQIEKKKSDLLKQKNILNEEEFKKQLFEIEKDIQTYNQKIKKKNQDLSKIKNMGKEEFYKKISIILKDYIQENSIEILLNKKNILIAKKELDVTSDILNLFDKNVKSINVK